MSIRKRSSWRLGVLASASLLTLAALPVLAEAAAAADPVCKGYPTVRRVGSLGGRNTFSKQPANTQEALRSLFVLHESEIRQVLASQGAGDLADGLFQAVASGEGVSQRDLRRGEIFQWMAWRRAGKATATKDLCFAATKLYRTWVVRVVQETKSADCNKIDRTTHTFLIPEICLNIAYEGAKTEQIEKPPVPAPVCQLKVQRMCDPSRKDVVDATGSSSGVEVTRKGPDGSGTIIAAGSTNLTWSGQLSNPYEPTTYTARGSNVDNCGRPQTCEKSVTATPCIRPSCEIRPSVTEVRAGKPFSVDVSGHWAGDQLSVEITNPKGKVVDSLTPPFPQDVTIKRSGKHTFSGTATNELGDTAACNQPVVTVKARWSVRGGFSAVQTQGPNSGSPMMMAEGIASVEPATGSGAPLTAARGPAAQSFQEPEVRSQFGFGNGDAVNLGFDYQPNDRMKFATTLLIGGLESTFTFDIADQWDMQTKDVDYVAILFGPAWDLIPNKRTSLYLGPVVGFFSLDAQTYDVLGRRFRFDFDDQVVFGAQVGLRFPLGADSSWGLDLNGTYVNVSADAGGTIPVDIDINPPIFTLGIVRDF